MTHAQNILYEIRLTCSLYKAQARWTPVPCLYLKREWSPKLPPQKVDPGLLFKLIRMLLAIVLPLMLSINLEKLYMFNCPTDINLHQMVVISKNTTGTGVVKYTGPNWSSDDYDNKIEDVKISVKKENNQLVVTIGYGIIEINEIELYMYIEALSLLETPQLIYIRTYSSKPIYWANIGANIRSVYKPSVQESADYSNYLPSNHLWNPYTAINRHISQDFRLDVGHQRSKITPSLPGDEANIQVILDASSINILEEFTVIQLLYTLFVYFIYFAFLVNITLSRVGDILFENNILKSIRKIEKH